MPVPYTKNLFKFISFLKLPLAPFTHIFYRIYLSSLCVPIYIKHPKLLLLEIFYVIEESFSFILYPIYTKFEPQTETKPIYGTLPFSSWKKIEPLIPCPLTQKTQICDLGSGKGKALLYFEIMYKCQTYAVENHRYFYNIHRFMNTCFTKKNTNKIYHQNIINHPLPQHDIILISGLGFPQNVLNNIQKKINSLSHTPTIISIGVLFHLPKYTYQDITVETSWGESIVYIYNN